MDESTVKTGHCGETRGALGEEHPSYEQAFDSLIAYALLHPTDVVLDVGAGRGMSAMHYIAGGAKQVHTVEPHPGGVHFLRELRSPRLVIHECALGSYEGVTQLPKYGVTALLKRWDLLFSDKRFNYVKISPSAETVEILRGGLESLRYLRPRVLQVYLREVDIAETKRMLFPLYKKCYRAIISPNGSLRMTGPLEDVSSARKKNWVVDPSVIVFVT